MRASGRCAPTCRHQPSRCGAARARRTMLSEQLERLAAERGMLYPADAAKMVDADELQRARGNADQLRRMVGRLATSRPHLFDQSMSARIRAGRSPTRRTIAPPVT